MTQPAPTAAAHTPQQPQPQRPSEPQLVRPEDGELGPVLAKMHAHLLGAGGATSSSPSPSPAAAAAAATSAPTPTTPAAAATATSHYESLARLVAGAATLESLFPAQLLTAIRDHFAPA